MANLTISMSKIRKILKMYSQQRAIMTIAAQADASRNTVKKYIAAFNDSGFTFEEVNALNDKELEDFKNKLIDTSVKGILEKLDLRRPIYSQTSAYGHFGKEGLPWEELVTQ